MKNSFFAFLGLALLLVAVPCKNAVQAADSMTKPVFVTWDGFEVDKCASIWLIKKFVSKDATIEILPKGTSVQQGIPFDIPDAVFRRSHNRSTYEALLVHYKLNDPRLKKIGEIVHDIEINTWNEKRFPESHQIQKEIKTLVDKANNNKELIKKIIAYFEWLYKIK